MTKKALIIAAGTGSRLRGSGRPVPKPLRMVAGLPLLKRIILTAKTAGITEFVIVVGYEKEQIIGALTRENLGVRLSFVENPDWQKSNGLSVLAARDHLRENFVLLMSDHIFEAETLRRLRETPLGNHKTLLAVDFKVGKVFDIDDATKVKTTAKGIGQIGKSVADFNAIDTGMFLATPHLFSALDEARKNGDCSLSDGIQILATRGEIGFFDIDDAFWQDVDTLPALRHAEKILFASCRKPTDGVVSRNLNRRISLWVTRQLVKTNLSATHVTGFTLLIGILSAFFVARGDYWNALAGATLFQLASILDGCDGEISKLKFTRSRLGQWLDTLCDNLTYLFFVVGVVVGLVRQGQPHIVPVASVALFGVVMTLTLMFYYLIRHTTSGSLVAVHQAFTKTETGNPFLRFLKKSSIVMKRDFFAFAFFLMALFDRLDLILWTCLIGANATWLVMVGSRMVLSREPELGVKESPDPASW